MKRQKWFWFIALALVFLVGGCSAPPAESIKFQEKDEEKETKKMTMPYDKNYQKQEGREVIYLAGGCFWGMEKLMQSIPGVQDAVSGYANGQGEEEPTYETIGSTGYRETVRVVYDPKQVSLQALLSAYFHVIDPTIHDAQGNDRGSQYQTGVYYADEKSREIVENVAELERRRYDTFAVEIGWLERFYDAEDYHQDYLDKNPGGYCHISRDEMAAVGEMFIDPARYPRPKDEEIRKSLTAQQFRITQEAETEAPYQNEFWEDSRRGIYVDVVTGEPLFSSADKYESSCGWPSFSKSMDPNTMVELEDKSHGMHRTEVRSRTGNSHLGHVFQNDPESPNGVRYCINSASLRFVPYEEMEVQGYGYLMHLVK